MPDSVEKPSNTIHHHALEELVAAQGMTPPGSPHPVRFQVLLSHKWLSYLLSHLYRKDYCPQWVPHLFCLNNSSHLAILLAILGKYPFKIPLLLSKAFPDDPKYTFLRLSFTILPHCQSPHFPASQRNLLISAKLLPQLGASIPANLCLLKIPPVLESWVQMASLLHYHHHYPHSYHYFTTISPSTPILTITIDHSRHHQHNHYHYHHQHQHHQYHHGYPHHRKV